MSEPLYRPARPEDLPEMTELFLVALKDLYTRNNVSAPLPPQAAVTQGYGHVRSTGIFHVAEYEHRIIGMAGAVVRDHIWYLSAFWVQPEMQRMKIGMPLLRRVWDAGKEMGATVYFTWSSIDLTAMAAYMKLGMVPGFQNFFFDGAPKRHQPVTPGYIVSELDKSTAMTLDEQIRATGRQVDHDFWFDLPNMRGRQVDRNGEVVAYFYYQDSGLIGPAAWKEPVLAETILNLACREASELSPDIRFAVPGINHSALRYAFESGLRLTSFAHFLTTSHFGRLEQYLPSGQSLY